ncbi:MAG TPA: endonuclease III [Ignavibacteriaceae bacterium]|nr:endonuclease III [Ignavibacteriaceae bacterium]
MLKRKIEKANNLLIKKYGIPQRSKTPPDPVDMIIATILSQNTNDKNSYKAFQNLKGKYKSWNEVAKLTTAQIEKLIKTAGLGKQKSKAIKNLLITLLKEKGKISLKYLNKMEDEEILKELTTFPGVGLKTASCVLLFAMRKNFCPVDTHVHRTTNRIGIVMTSTPDKSFKILNENMPDGMAHQFHTNLIRLGREICKPSKPSCKICPLLKICEYPDKNLEETTNYKINDFLLLDSIK